MLFVNCEIYVWYKFIKFQRKMIFKRKILLKFVTFGKVIPLLICELTKLKFLQKLDFFFC